MSRAAATLASIACFLVAPPIALSRQQFDAHELDFTHEFGSEGTTAVKGGLVVGSGHDVYGIPMPALFDATGGHLLPLLPNDYDGTAYGLDGNGNVLGQSSSPSPYAQRAVLWSGGVVTDLQTLVTGGANLALSAALDGDSNGRIVGTGWDIPGGEPRGFLLDQGTLTDVGSLFASPQQTVARAMNDAGQVVGFSGDFVVKHAFFWDQGVLTDLHDPAQIAGDDSVANDVDSAGAVCGSAEIVKDQLQACVWSQGTVTGLGFLSATAKSSRANAMNDAGDVVGTSTDAAKKPRAVLWTGGSIVDLNTFLDPTLGITLVEATGIDEEGRIAVTGVSGTKGIAFLLLPDCDGSFTPYGTPYPGTGGIDPLLVGWGCPSPDQDFAVAAVDCVGNAFGLLFLGTGTTQLSTGRGPVIQVAPLLPLFLPILTNGEGDWSTYANLPASLGTFDLNLQLLVVDRGASNGLSSTNPITLHFE